jgi:hypothetical protein
MKRFTAIFSLFVIVSIFLFATNGFSYTKTELKQLIKAYQNGQELTEEQLVAIQDVLPQPAEQTKNLLRKPTEARVVVLDEDFSSGALPTGWQNVDNVGGGEIWVFNNPGARTINTTTGANGFAIFDSDFNGAASGPENSDLITLPLDCSTLTNVILEFEHYFQAGFGGLGELFVSGDSGTNWTSLQSWSALTTPNAETVTYDITTIAAGQSQVLIRWNWIGDYSWYWAVDDVRVYSLDDNPLMVVTPDTLYDTVLVGGTTMDMITVENAQSLPSVLNFTVTEDPAVAWLAVTPNSGSVLFMSSLDLDVNFDASGLTAGAYTTSLIVAGNDTTNAEDTVQVFFQVNQAPIISWTPDSMSFTLDPFGIQFPVKDSLTMTLSNTGTGPLNWQGGEPPPELMY